MARVPRWPGGPRATHSPRERRHERRAPAEDLALCRHAAGDRHAGNNRLGLAAALLLQPILGSAAPAGQPEPILETVHQLRLGEPVHGYWRDHTWNAAPAAHLPDRPLPRRP